MARMARWMVRSELGPGMKPAAHGGRRRRGSADNNMGGQQRERAIGMDVVGDDRLALARRATARSPGYSLAGRALMKVAGPCIINLRARLPAYLGVHTPVHLLAYRMSLMGTR